MTPEYKFQSNRFDIRELHTVVAFTDVKNKRWCFNRLLLSHTEPFSRTAHKLLSGIWFDGARSARRLQEMLTTA